MSVAVSEALEMIGIIREMIRRVIVVIGIITEMIRRVIVVIGIITEMIAIVIVAATIVIVMATRVFPAISLYKEMAAIVTVMIRIVTEVSPKCEKTHFAAIASHPSYVYIARTIIEFITWVRIGHLKSSINLERSLLL